MRRSRLPSARKYRQAAMSATLVPPTSMKQSSWEIWVPKISRPSSMLGLYPSSDGQVAVFANPGGRPWNAPSSGTSSSPRRPRRPPNTAVGADGRPSSTSWPEWRSRSRGSSTRWDFDRRCSIGRCWRSSRYAPATGRQFPSFSAPSESGTTKTTTAAAAQRRRRSVPHSDDAWGTTFGVGPTRMTRTTKVPRRKRVGLMNTVTV
mmetsp:Transcript_39863/g.73541  ORF Transcript_39863/g.73541 Transcript_39863/m.73541 type:complete len:205 (-) Transcript_39863:288-902(-)